MAVSSFRPVTVAVGAAKRQTVTVGPRRSTPLGPRGAAGGLCAAAAAADLVEAALDREGVAGEEHSHALARVALAAMAEAIKEASNGGPQHLALLAVLDPVAIL